MASLVTSVLIPLRTFVYTPVEVVTASHRVPAARRPALVCRWVRDDSTGRPVARWVAEPGPAEAELANSSRQITALLRSSDQAVA
jgi:hypothetical protein